MTSRQDKNTQVSTKKKKKNWIQQTPKKIQPLPIIAEVLVQENNCPFQGDIEEKKTGLHIDKTVLQKHRILYLGKITDKRKLL